MLILTFLFQKSNTQSIVFTLNEYNTSWNKCDGRWNLINAYIVIYNVKRLNPIKNDMQFKNSFGHGKIYIFFF